MRINTFLPFAGRWKIVSIFAYSTKGVPGIEIKGLEKRGTLIKEKLIYLSRLNQIKVPMRKYVICIDLPRESKIDIDTFKWLELPILLLFWHMLDALPIKKLEDCFVAGSVASTGKITVLEMDAKELERLNFVLENNYQLKMKYLAPKKKFETRNIYQIPLENLFEGKNFSFTY